MTFTQVLQEKITQFKGNTETCNILKDIEKECNEAYHVKSLSEYWEAFKTPLELRIRFRDR